MAKRRDYQAEYRHRVSRRREGPQLPRRVLRGHGAIPVGIARKLEAGELSAAEREVYAPTIRRYEARYGPAGHGRAGRERTLPRRFDSEEEAEEWAEDFVPTGYFHVKGVAGKWVIAVLR